MAWQLRRTGQQRATAILDGALRAMSRGVAGRDEETALWVEQRNERLSGCQGSFLWWTVLPRSPSGDDRVGEDKHLPGAGNERALVLLSGRDESPVKRDELPV